MNAMRKEALQRCLDCWEDGEGHDVSQSIMKELEKHGYVIRLKRPGFHYEITDLGRALLESEQP